MGLGKVNLHLRKFISAVPPCWSPLILSSFHSIRVIDHFVDEGSHYVECQLQGVEGVQVADFKLLGIFAS